MFNYCVISGWVLNEPNLRYYGKDLAIADFKIAFWLVNHQGGTITVLCYDELAIHAIRYVKKTETVMVCGYISGDKWQSRDGRWWQSLHLNASDVAVLDAETIRREQEALLEK